MSEAIQETPEVIDSIAIERQMLEDAKKKSDDPIETAAMMFTMYRPNFSKSLAKLSSRGRARVLEALVLSPLIEIKLANEAEKEAFFYGDSMLQAKFIMTMSTYKDHAEELLAAQDLAKSAVIETEYTKEVGNESI